MRKICVITGTRAEYGLLSRLIKKISEDESLQLQIIATNMHLSPEYGLTYKEIENDGFFIDKKLHMLISSDTENAIVKSMGLSLIGFADAYEDLKPDLIVILGDRYEMLSAAAAALIYRVPIAHLYGGEITEGAFDDSIRHAITKMSHLHFTATSSYRERVIQLGELPERVFNVGSIGVENIKKIPLLSKSELEKLMEFKIDKNTILVTYHPVTLIGNLDDGIDNLLSALDYVKNTKVVFTMPNSDTGSKIIGDKISKFVNQNRERSVVYSSLGLIKYLSAMQFVGAVVGNSSSGITEAPSFGIPTLNIGDRQKGRLTARSVVHCGTTQEEITKGLEKIFSDDIVQYAKSKENPYDKSGTVNSICEVLRAYPLEHLVPKTFYDL